MYIKSIVLDGFKSYGNRIEVTGFDPQFNAITGLNGTGKSNILDSICFVLGITNLSNVRAGSLQELIYKHGQAGITKATVSITFDNRDRRHCPIGYENLDEITVTRQVVMGGKNKYLINGINVQNKRVSDLFCSVQLNVNNPHFLIMQGRITKVLNMKPHDILSMVEEAAGTRMYETKKQAAEKTIEKKDSKLKELNEIINEDIAPRLKKLQDERSQFQEYQKVVRELDNLTRLHIAWKYNKADENAKEIQSKLTEAQDTVRNKKEQIENNKKEIKKIEKEISEVHKKLDEEGGSALRSLEAEGAGLGSREVETSQALRIARDAAREHELKLRAQRGELQTRTQALQEHERRLEESSVSLERLRAALGARRAARDGAQQRLAAGLHRPGDSQRLRDQQAVTNDEQCQALNRMKSCDLQIQEHQSTLQKLEAEFKQCASQFQHEQRLIAEKEDRLRRLEGQLAGVPYSAGAHAALRARALELRARARAARGRAERLACKLQRCTFRYTDPEPGFDKRRVLGPVCRLVSAPDPEFCRALEVAAGARLFNVVVDTAATGKLLLERGGLRQRTTVIPLDKITPQDVPEHVVDAARRIGGSPSSVHAALALVACAARVRPAVSWALGGALVARELDAARRMAYHPQVGRRVVLLDGDVLDPAGTLSGGAPIKSNSVLLELQELNLLEQELESNEAELTTVTAEIQSMDQLALEYTQLQKEVLKVQTELEARAARVGSSREGALHAHIQELRAGLARLAGQRAAADADQAAAAARLADLDHQLGSLDVDRARDEVKAEASRTAAEYEQCCREWEACERQHDELALETEQLRSAAQQAAGQLARAEDAAAGLRAELQDAQRHHAAAEEALNEIKARIDQQKAQIAERNDEISALMQRMKRLKASSEKLELEVSSEQLLADNLRTDAGKCAEYISSLEKEHAWIAHERQYFGAAGGAYEWAACGAQAAGERLEQLRERRDALSRGLNPRAHVLLGREEDQYADLLRKRTIVEADRTKLLQVIAELDERKLTTLREACDRVDRDFGAIFGKLLPGACAELRADSESELLGLRIRVGFSGTWKESLAELSGGQRSLVALSLVLALLLFNPAPLYILDEVDAALDLSHTQNIGQMLRDHFKHSQFIIVSLKDGMFNNANVLFRTRFMDGMSAVERVVNDRR